MAWTLEGEQPSILFIIMGTAVLGSLFYAFTINVSVTRQHQQMEILANAMKSVAKPPPTPPQKTQPPPPSPEEQKEARAKHIALVQTSLQNKLLDVETYFQTRELFETSELRAQLRKERQQEAYMDYMAQPQLHTQTPPTFHVIQSPAAQATRMACERIPFLPGPGEYDPLAVPRRPPVPNMPDNLAARPRGLREGHYEALVPAPFSSYDFNPTTNPRVEQWLWELPTEIQTGIGNSERSELLSDQASLRYP